MWISRAIVQNIQKKNFAFWSMGNPYELLTSKEIRAIEDAYILINNFRGALFWVLKLRKNI